MSRQYIKVFSANETDFSTNGKMMLFDAEDVDIYVEYNGSYDMNFTLPLTDEYANGLVLLDIVQYNGQLFRVSDLSTDTISSTISVNCTHVFYDMSHFLIDDLRPTNLSLKDAMNHLFTNLEGCPFRVSHSDFSNISTIYIVEKPLLEGFFDILERWDIQDYYLVRNNFDIEIRKIDHNNVVAGLNSRNSINGVNHKMTYNDSATRLLPQGFNNLQLPETYIDIPSDVVVPAYQITKKIKFENVMSLALLRERAMQVAKIMGRPTRTLRLDLTDRDLNYLADELYVGASVHVSYAPLQIDEVLTVASLRYDGTLNQISEVVLSSLRDDISSEIDRIVALDKKVSDTLEPVSTNNLVMNSSFERENKTTKEALGWTGGRIVRFDKGHGAQCLMLEYGQTLRSEITDHHGRAIAPDVSVEDWDYVEFSFLKKGGECQVQLFDAVSMAPIECVWPDGKTRSSYNIGRTDSWNNSKYFLQFKKDTYSKLMMSFSNIDYNGDRVFIDSVQICEAAGSNIGYVDGPESTPLTNEFSDVWMEQIYATYTPYLEVVFLRYYENLPNISITSSSEAPVPIETTFKKSTINNVDYYSSVVISTKPGSTTAIDDNITITILGKGV